MRQIRKIFIASLLMFFAAIACSQDTPPPPPPAPPAPFDLGDLFNLSLPKKATLKDYKSTYDTYNMWSERFDDEELYKDLELVEKLSEEKKKFSELSSFEKDIFYLLQADVISTHLLQLKIHWNEEHTTRVTAKTSPTEKEISIYINKLERLRTTHAVRYEKKIEDVFEKHKNNLTEEEKKVYLKNVREWHDSEKLIKRE